MPRRLRIEWSPGAKVTALLAAPKRAGPVGVLLAHGAGRGQEHPFMTHLRDGLAAHGHLVMTFDYPYMEAGRGRPDRIERLLACHEAAAERLASYAEQVVLAGKSMGGRVGSHLAGDRGWPASHLVYFGYPLVPMGTGDPRSTTHLGAIEAPQLFFAGTRDRLSPPKLIEPLAAALPDATVIEVDDADHSFRVPKRAGLEWEQVLDRLVAGTADWIAASPGRGGQRSGAT